MRTAMMKVVEKSDVVRRALEAAFMNMMMMMKMTAR